MADFDVTVQREKYIGGSDVPIIMGLSKFKTRWHLLLEKAGLREDDFKGNVYTAYGNYMESKIRDYINEIRFTNFAPARLTEDDMRCHVDGANIDTILEVKTTSDIYESVDDYKVYLVQLLKYMEVYKLQKGLLAVYERPADLSYEFEAKRLTLYDINIKDYQNLLIMINAELDRFRADLKRLKENPLLTEEDFQPAELVSLSRQVIELEDKMAIYKDIEAQYKKMKKSLYDAMQKADVKSWTMPNGTRITRVDGTPASTEIVKEFDLDKFKAEYPCTYSDFLVERVKKNNGRAGFVKITLPKG